VQVRVLAVAASMSVAGVGVLTMTNKFERRIPYFGDFVLFDEIGRGGMGVVYNAQQSTLDRPVALKVLHSSFRAGESGAQRLRIEAEAAARLDHPNIVPVFEFGEHDGHPYLAMQLVEGESLAEHLRNSRRNEDEKDVALLMLKIARAVHHAHQRGVLHRDLKPGNILIDASGEPHLIDFGLARCLEQDAGITQTGTFFGTPAYTSPEQAAGQNKSITIASDIYSLGAVLYALLTGKPPFVAESPTETIEKVKSESPRQPRSIRSNLSVDLEIICLKCLQKEPSHRYASTLALAEDIERFLAGRPIMARKVGILEQAWMWIRRNPVHSTLGLATVLAAAASLAGVLFWRNAQAQARENESLLNLGSTISVSRTRYPRKMSWSENIRRSLAPGQVATQRSYYRDQVAATLDGLDAALLARYPAYLNEHVFFNRAGDMLFLAGATNAAWAPVLFRTNSENAIAYPGKTVAFPKEAPLQVVHSASGKLAAWHVSQGRILCDLEFPPGLAVPQSKDGILSAASSDANLLALVLSGGEDGDTLVFWQLPSGEIIRTVAVDSSITTLGVSADGSVAAGGNLGGQVFVWEVSSGRVLDRHSLSTLPVRSVAFGRNVRQKAGPRSERPGWLLAAGDEGGSIGIWNLADHRVQAMCRGGYYQVFILAFSPDNMILASGGRGPVRLWDVATGTPLLDLSGDYCGALSFSPDGGRLAASTDHHLPARQISVWELQNGRGIAALRGLSSGATKVAFSPGGDRLAAVGMGWELGVWDLKQKKLLHILETPRGFTADNFALAFNPDGRLLAISTGEEAQLWDADTGEHLRSWKLWPGIADALSFPADNALFLLRMETLQGTEMPLSDAPWQEYPRVCRLRNLLATEPLKAVREIDEFNAGVFGISASANGQFFVIEGINVNSGTRSRRIMAVNSSGGQAVWRTVSTNQAVWAINPFASSGAQFAFTTNGKEYRLKDLSGTNDDSRPFPHTPAAIGPVGNIWAVRGEETGAARGVSYFMNGTLCVNLGVDSEILLSPCFDSKGRWLAWGSADGTISLCDLPEIHAQLGRSGLAW
jgi:eukaryotic-like serine/threonine-protein kinase